MAFRWQIVVLTFALAVAALLPGRADAACTGPYGENSEIAFNTGTGRLMYCSGNEWVGFPPESAPAAMGCANAGDTCDDGTLYAGLSPDGSTPMYAARCDAGQTWTDPGIAPDSGLVHRWKFDEAGGGPFADSAGSSQCVITNGGSAISVAGKDGTAIAGNNRDINCDVVSAVLGASQVTMSVWIKKSVAGEQIHIGTVGDGTSQFGIAPWGTYVSFVTAAPGGGAWEDGTYNLNDTAWHHYTLVFDGTQTGNSNRLKGYIDGVQVSLTYSGGSIPATTSATSMDFGPWVAAGTMDDLRIYNRALSAVEVAALYNATGGIPICSGAATYQWGPNGVDTGAGNCVSSDPGTQPGCSTGAANTALLAGLGASYQAATACSNLTMHGHTDWYLPAQNELDVVYDNLGPSSTNGFEPTFWYWSSSESGTDGAWDQTFDSGVQSGGPFSGFGANKTDPDRVRCVRKETSQTGCNAIGDVCNDGTVYAGLSPDGSARMYVARCDEGQTWNGSSCTGTASMLAWSESFSETLANSDDTGEYNTQLMMGMNDMAYPGAQSCNTKNFNGGDWYVPALAELQVLYDNRTAIGNFASAPYWSSTQNVNWVFAKILDFSDGSNSEWYGKQDPQRVRCVRKVPYCQSPLGRMSEIAYNTDHRVLQWCDGVNWRAVGPLDPAGPMAGCASPAGTGGEVVFNSTSCALQYCDGDNWRAVGAPSCTCGPKSLSYLGHVEQIDYSAPYSQDYTYTASSLAITADGSKVAVAGQYNNIIALYDVANPADPTYLGSYYDSAGTQLGWLNGMQISGDYLYAIARNDFNAGNNGLILSFDISDPANPTLVDSLNAPGFRQIWDIELSTDRQYAYVVSYVYDDMSPDQWINRGWFHVIDISTPSNLSVVSSVHFQGHGDYPNRIAVYGTTAFVSFSDGNGGIAAVDVSNPAAPVVADSVFNGAQVSGADSIGVTADGQYAFVAGRFDGAFAAYNVSDPYNITYVSRLVDAAIGDFSRMTIQGNTAMLASEGGTGTLALIDISNPASMSILEVLSGPPYFETPADTIVYGNLVFVADPYYDTDKGRLTVMRMNCN